MTNDQFTHVIMAIGVASLLIPMLYTTIHIESRYRR
jgi:hypothetical protein